MAHPLPFPTASPPYPKPLPQLSNPNPASASRGSLCRRSASRRDVTIIAAAAAADAASTPRCSAAAEEAAPPSPARRNPLLGGIANTTSWFQYFGSGFSIRVPPSFDDIMEPEDYNAVTYYGDKAKPQKYAASFASPDRSEVLSVVIRPSNQLKITFLEAKDITDFGTLKAASKIFVPGGAKLYSARTIKVKDEEDIRTYYFYEFGVDTQHVALVATINSGKTYIAGAAAPQTKWEDDGVKLRSAAISLSIS